MGFAGQCMWWAGLKSGESECEGQVTRRFHLT